MRLMVRLSYGLALHVRRRAALAKRVHAGARVNGPHLFSAPLRRYETVHSDIAHGINGNPSVVVVLCAFIGGVMMLTHCTGQLFTCT